MSTRGKIMMYAAAVMAVQLGVMPEGALAFRAPAGLADSQNIISSVKEKSNNPLQLKKVSLRKQGFPVADVQSAVALAEDIMNVGSSQAIAIASGLSARNSTGGSTAFLIKTKTDHLGLTHFRIAQEYKGLRVIGAELIVHVNDQGLAYMLNGQYQEDKDLDIEPAITAEDALHIGTENGGQVAQQPELVIYNGQLAWHYIIEQSGENPGQWYYYVDALNGQLINHYNNIMHYESAEVTGNRLDGEDGSVVTINGLLDSGGTDNYFLYSNDNLWGVYDLDASEWEQQATADWGENDPAAVSAGYNYEAVQNYVSTTLGRNSFNDAGAFAQVNVHEGTNYVNAYWDGSDFHFGDGDGSISNALTTLDISAHEYGHAITQYTSNLVYQYESGALNEAYSDILGTAVEFAIQPDGTGSYPDATPGHADWLCGEDTWLYDVALRDLKDPQRYEQPSYYQGTYWYTGTGDNGGVHYNSGVANFAYYLLAEGGVGSNDGHSYDITGIGREGAAAVALRANYYYHTSGDQYADARTAWIQAAQDLGYDTQTVADVWTACGVMGEEEPIGEVSHDMTPPANTSAGQGSLLGPISVEHTNGTDATVEFTTQGYLVFPDGNTRTIGESEVKYLLAGETKGPEFYLFVPGGVPTGTYTLGAKINYIDSSIADDDDSFEFTVTSSTIRPTGKSAKIWKLIER
ncbi:hypothetical protein KKHLCK_02975 [Candidatus Electrothrix laxa]